MIHSQFSTQPNSSHENRTGPEGTPVYPKPTPNWAGLFVAFFRGFHSWIGVTRQFHYVRKGVHRLFFGWNLFLVNDSDDIQRIKVSEPESFPKHPLLFWTLKPLIKNAVFSVNGDEWKQQRVLVDKAFKLAGLRQVYPQMREAVQSMLARLNSLNKELFVEIDSEMTMVTADVIVRTILSRSIEDQEARQVFDAFKRYQRRAGHAGILRIFRVPASWLENYLSVPAQEIRRWILACIEERLDTHSDNRTKHYDFLQAFIDSQDPSTGYRFSTQDLLNQTCFLFLAGHETSASSLSMAMYLLSIYPRVQERLRNDVRTVLSERNPNTQSVEEILTFDELRKIPYAEAIFNETLRLYPPVSFLFHEPSQESELMNKKCPLKSLIIISPWIVQRHKSYWQYPAAFDPDRFLNSLSTEEEKKLAKEAFLPFGLGPRKCPGAAFALQEAMLVMAEIVRRYELMPDPKHSPKLVSRLTLRSQNGIRLRLRPLDAPTA